MTNKGVRFRIFEKESGREISLSDLALKLSEENNLVYSDIECLAMDPITYEWYLLDECGNYAYIDLGKYEVVIEEASEEDTCVVCGHKLSVHLDEGDGWRCHSFGPDLSQCECFLRKFRDLLGEIDKEFYSYRRRVEDMRKELLKCRNREVE